MCILKKETAWANKFTDESVKEKIKEAGLQKDQSTFTNAQLCSSSVWSDWLIVKA